MRYIILFAILITLLSCKKKDKIIDLSDIENCMYSLFIDSLSKYTQYENAFTIEASKPHFKEQKIKYTTKELQDFKTDNNTYKIVTHEAFSYFKLKGKEDSYKLKHHLDGFMLCKVNVSKREEEFTLEQLEKKDFSITIKTIEEKAKLIKRYTPYKSHIRCDSIMNFKAGYYTPILTAGDHGYQSQINFVYKIQKKLIEKGYNLSETGTFDKNTKKAIDAFQEKHNLDKDVLDNRFFEYLEFE